MHNPFPKRNQPSTRNLPKQNNHLHVINPNAINRPIHNPPPKRNRRGGAYVPARTFAQRRFHTKNMRIVCGDFNDGCALVGRHGRAAAFPYQKYTHCARGMNDECALAGTTRAGTQALPLPTSINNPHMRAGT